MTLESFNNITTIYQQRTEVSDATLEGWKDFKHSSLLLEPMVSYRPAKSKAALLCGSETICPTWGQTFTNACVSMV